MARERFIFVLFNQDKQPMYVNNNGFVLVGDAAWKKPDGNPAKLTYSPTGWRDVLIKYFRNIRYWGVTRDMTVPMDFVRDGYTILKFVLWQPDGGIETIAYLGILKLDEVNRPAIYKPWYFSQLNFSKFKQARRSIKIEALEGGMSKVWKAFENTKFVIDIDNDPEHVNVLLDGINLFGKQNMIIADGILDPVGEIGDLFDFNFLMVKAQQEGFAPGILVSDSTYEQFIETDVPTSTNYFLREDGTNPVVVNVKIKGVLHLKLKTKRDNTWFFASLIKSNSTTPFPITKYWIYNVVTEGDTIFTTEGEIQNIPIDFTIPISPGDKLWFNGKVGNGTGFGQDSAWEILPDSEIVIEYQGKISPTFVKGLYLRRVLEKLVEKMVGTFDILSPDNIYTQSDWLDAKKDVIVTSSDAIRGLPATIETSISDFFKAVNHYSAGLEIKNQRIRIEPRDFFFTDEVVLDLGEVKDCTLEPASDLAFNKIKVGTPDEIDYQDVNGKFEFTQTQNWRAPVTVEDAEYDLTLPYRVDPYGIELLRKGYVGKDSTDVKGDNDVFMLHIEANKQILNLGFFTIEYYNLNRPAFTLLEGVPDPVGIFNIEFSPKRTILNNMNDILSRLDRLDGKLIEMTSAIKNAELKTTLAGVTVDEDAPIQIGSIGTKKFQPYYFNFTTKVPVTLPPIIDEKPYGKIRFTYNGNEWFGRWMDGGIKEGDKDTQVFKLLVAENNDLKKF